jgi:hypothetical protein
MCFNDIKLKIIRNRKVKKKKQNLKRVKNKAHNIHRIFCLFRTTFFLSSKAMWVAIDCRSKNWVAALNCLGSTDLGYIPLNGRIMGK